MRIAALWHPFVRNIRLRKRIALQHADDRVEKSDSSRAANRAAMLAPITIALLTNMLHGNTPALFACSPQGLSLVRRSDRTGSDPRGRPFVKHDLKPLRSAFVSTRALRVDLAVFSGERGRSWKPSFRSF